jgi:cell division protein FtsN
MSRGNSSSDEPSFLRMLVWTILLALVFSVGLIAGQRMIRRDRVKPLVSVTHQQADEATKEPTTSDDSVSERFFSFYDRLADGTEGLSPGTSTDEPDAKDEASDQEAPDAPAKYTLQVSAHPKMAGAKEQVARLEARGLDPYVVTVQRDDGETYYRVRIGKFSTMKEVETFKADIARNRGIDAMVTPL